MQSSMTCVRLMKQHSSRLPALLRLSPRPVTTQIGSRRDYASLHRDQAYIGGAWVSGNDGNTYPVINPANGVEIGRIPDLGVAETEDAIKAAYQAFQVWRETTAKERSDICRKMFNLMMTNQEELAKIITAENVRNLNSLKSMFQFLRVLFLLLINFMIFAMKPRMPHTL